MFIIYEKRDIIKGVFMKSGDFETSGLRYKKFSFVNYSNVKVKNWTAVTTLKLFIKSLPNILTSSKSPASD